VSEGGVPTPKRALRLWAMRGRHLCLSYWRSDGNLSANIATQDIIQSILGILTFVPLDFF